MVTHVDDGLIFANSEGKCLTLIESPRESFDTRVVEGSILLGIEKARSGDMISFRQTRYIVDMLDRFSMKQAKAISVPAIDVKKLSEPDDDEIINVPFRAAIGALLYLALNTRPDILFATIFLSRFNQSPKQKHWVAVKQVM